MAEELSVAFGHALVAIIDWAWPKARLRVGRLLAVAADAVRPSPPLSLVSVDGREVLTGLAVLDRGEVIAFLGARNPAVSRVPPLHGYPNEYDDEPLWDRPGRPYGR